MALIDRQHSTRWDLMIDIERLRTWIEVDRTAIRHNIEAIRSLLLPSVRIMAVVKADAYGHGALPCAQACLEAGASFLGAATPEEALELKEAFPGAPVLILGGLSPQAAPWLVRHGIRAMVSDPCLAKSLSEEAVRQRKEAAIHLKIDTGMGRIGAMPDEILNLFRQTVEMPGLRIEGLATHFATADCDLEYARYQLSIFQEVLERLKAHSLPKPITHAANSAAILSLPASHYDMVRPGLLVYGIPPYPGAEQLIGLRPALTWKTRVSLVRRLPEGAAVSYGCTCRMSRPGTVAVLPVGYADGFSRALSSRGNVLIKGRRAPILGRVCMDQCMVDVTGIPGVEAGEEAVLIGRQEEEVIDINETAELAGTIHHEIASRLGKRLPRIYLDPRQ